MSKNIDKLMELNDKVSLAFRRKHIIILNPKDKSNENNTSNLDVDYDIAEWKIPDKLSPLVNKLSQNNQLSNENKILTVFEEICKDYIYDDNLISYIQKTDDESYELPDWYGREIDQKWEENREQHNRRVCYEVSRYLAESLTKIFEGNEDFNVCILWDKGHTHYFVGLTCNDYSVTLDTDDFNNIKDLTRLKTGLTAQGITILSDKENKFKTALDEFNNNRNQDSIKKIEEEMANDSNHDNSNQDFTTNKETDDFIFIKSAIEILKEKYDIDSQGLYEYMKEIVDIKLGPESRKKVWKKINGDNNKATRYIRCLVIDINNEKYIIDVDRRILRNFDEEEFEVENPDFIPYKALSRDGSEPYDGT